jgi:hypothetical protein
MQYIWTARAKYWLRLILPLLLVASLQVFVSSGGPQGKWLPTAHADTQNAIQIENSKSGTPGWNDFSSDLTPDAISGYGSKISVNHGDSIDFYVTTTAASVSIDIFRTGYYGGVGARQVASLGSFPGVHQPMPTPDPVTGMISCNWSKMTTLTIPSDWVTGVYLAKLTASSGKQSFIFFVVRNDGGHEAIAFQTSVTTYQAYNTWGGTSLYNNLTDQKIYPYAHAMKVSFDRPFNPGDSDGAGHYFFYEYKFVYWAESQGLDLTYITDEDTHTNVNPLTNHKVFLSVGHDEYWSKGMRDNVQNAINAGVNVAFFSGNSVYWQIRFEPNAAGVPDRVEVGYKDFATDPTKPGPGPDPMWHVNNAIVTTNWRDDPVNLPENGLMGVMFEDQVSQSYPYVVQNASNSLYSGAGFTNGSSVDGIVGYEYDRVWNNGFSPPGLTVLSQSPVVCCGGTNSYANSTIYTAPSGARVFAAGTIQWSWGLANIQSNTYANAGIQQTTLNILNSFTGVTPQTVSLTPTTLDFGNQTVGLKSPAKTLTLTNNTQNAVTISSIAINGTNASDFTQSNNCGNSLAASSYCTINVTLNSSANGSRTANLTITDSAPNSPQSTALTGNGTTPTPSLSSSLSSVVFNNQHVSTTSLAQNITLTNNGTATLTLNSIALSGLNAGDFTQTNTCGSTLAINASCTVSVTFSPTAAGNRAASLDITDNAPDSPQSLPLSGTGVSGPPVIFFSDGFESGNLSKWTINNSDSTGQVSVQQAVVNSGSNGLSLANNSGQYGYVSTPLSGGAQNQTYTRFYFRTNNLASNTQLAMGRNVNGTNAWEVDYDQKLKGLDVYFWNGSNKVFSYSSPSNSISADTWYYIEIEDAQTTSGHGQAWLNGQSIASLDTDLSTSNPYARLMIYNGVSGTIYIDDVVASDTYNGPINTTPTPQATLSPTSLSFGNQAINATSSAQAITLTNTGTASLSISGVTMSGANAADFAQTNNCGSSLAVNASCTINVTFTPSASSDRTANISVADNAAYSPQGIALSGTGVTPVPSVSLNSTSLSFDNQRVGKTSLARTITLTNNGTATLTISGIAISGTNSNDFAQTNDCGSSVAPNASCTISVTFTPSATGTRSASVTVTDNAPDSPQSVSLSGPGTPANPTVYFSDGFETGDFSHWNLSNADSTGQATVQTSMVNSGTYAASFANTSGQYCYINTNLPSAQAQTYTRFYFRITDLTTGTQVAVGHNSSGSNSWEIDYNQNTQALEVYFWDGSNKTYSIASARNSISANTWYSVELQDNQSTTGHGELWLNGTSVAKVDADLSTANPYAKLMFYNAAASTVYIDDVVVSDNYNGLL